MNVKKYNDSITKYEVKEGSVTVDREAGEMVVKLNNSKTTRKKNKPVLNRKCVVVTDSKTGAIRALCDAFCVEINTRTSEARVTMY